MSQSQNTDTTATTSIQAKLGNLVDNTDDLNNYDSAMERLRTARSNYRKFRGNGGLIDGIQEQIEQTERDLAQAETQKDPLNEKQKQLKNCAKKKNSGMIPFLRSVKRSQRLLHSRRPRRCAINSRNWRKDLHDAVQLRRHWTNLIRRGYPTKTEIAEQSKNILTIGNSQKDLIQLKLLRPEDVQCETQNRELFCRRNRNGCGNPGMPERLRGICKGNRTGKCAGAKRRTGTEGKAVAAFSSG